MSGLDLDSLVAIDVHVHVEQDLHGHVSLDQELRDAASRYFKGEPYHPTVPQVAEDYRAQHMAAVIFTVDSELTTGHLQQGVPARVVMEVLGHSQISLTLGTYSHVVPELAEEAAQRMEDALWS